MEKSGKSRPPAAFSNCLATVGHFMETQNINSERNFPEACVAQYLILQKRCLVCMPHLGQHLASLTLETRLFSFWCFHLLQGIMGKGAGGEAFSYHSRECGIRSCQSGSDIISDTPPPFPGLCTNLPNKEVRALHSQQRFHHCSTACKHCRPASLSVEVLLKVSSEACCCCAHLFPFLGTSLQTENCCSLDPIQPFSAWGFLPCTALHACILGWFLSALGCTWP